MGGRPRVIPSSEFTKEQRVSVPIISADGERLAGRMTANGNQVRDTFLNKYNPS
jgi:hypothetical protein